MAAFGLVRGSAQADMLQLSAGNPITTDLLAQVQASTACGKFCHLVMAPLSRLCHVCAVMSWQVAQTHIVHGPIVARTVLLSSGNYTSSTAHSMVCCSSMLRW